MNIVVPAGNKKLDWSPKEVEMTKVASAGTVVAEEVDSLYEAAKKHLDSIKTAQFEAKEEKTEEKCKDCGCEKKECKCVQKKEDEVTIDVGKKAEDKPVEEKAEDSAVAKIEEAVIEIEDAVEEIKGVQTEEVAEEVEIEVKDEGKEVVPGKEVSDGEVIVVSEPSPVACMADKKEEVKVAEKKEETKVASVDDEFQKYAKLSPENKKKLNNFWTNMLGYPKDYVDLMTKDYEK